MGAATPWRPTCSAATTMASPSCSSTATSPRRPSPQRSWPPTAAPSSRSPSSDGPDRRSGTRTMTTRFDLDTAPVAQGDGRYASRIDGGWWIQRGPNGGYLAAVLVQPLVAEVADPDRHLRSLTIHYLAPPTEGPAEVTVRSERTGRTVQYLTARLQQGE